MTVRTAELSRCRADRALSEEDCRIWFGVSLSTLERVEAGEIVPGAELQAKIDRFLNIVGGGCPSLRRSPGVTAFAPDPDCPPSAHGGGPLGGTAVAGGRAVSFDGAQILSGAAIPANRGAR